MGKSRDSLEEEEIQSDVMEIDKAFIENSKNPRPATPKRKNTAVYITELMRKELSAVGITDAVTISTWQDKADNMTLDEFLAEAKKLKEEKPDLNLTKIERYVVASNLTTIMSSQATQNNVGDEVIDAILPSIFANKQQGNNLMMFSQPLKISYEQGKSALRYILNEYINLDTNCEPSEITLPFIISEEQSLTGQIISNLDNTKKSVTLLTVYEVNGQFIYQFFGEPKSGEIKKQPTVSRYNELFYVYKFASDTLEDVILLSPKELEITSCRIHGMEANCYDFLKIGNIAKINTTQKIFFVNSQQPTVDKIKDSQFWKIAKKFGSREAINEAYFGKYPHPEWFSAFIISWTLSCKLGKMPTHLSLMSPPAQGKTQMLENLGKVFEQAISAGGTIKGLVPSFANGIPKEGYLIRCKRFAFVDEFIHVIQTSNRNNSDFDGGSHHLLKVLEHSDGEFSSAFGIIKAKPKMWTMFCSNVRPHEHIKNLVDLHSKLNVAFMSRLLWYVFDEEHLAYINSKKSEVMTYDEKAIPKHSPELMSITDYTHSIIVPISTKDIEDILAKFRPLVPADLELDIYDSRMIMHFYRIVDGYAKYKSIIEQRGKFICTPEDLKEIEDILGRIVRSWSRDLDDKCLTPAMKVTYLNANMREVFDFIKMNQQPTLTGTIEGVSETTLRATKGITAVNVAEMLVTRGILKLVSGTGNKIYYTYEANI